MCVPLQHVQSVEVIGSTGGPSFTETNDLPMKTV